MKTGDYRICSRCIMDTSDPDIRFDAAGVCNYCRNSDELLRAAGYFDEKLKAARLEALIAEIKAAGKDREYDCVIGLSGGVDSSYAAYIVKRLGLKPLAIHLDNGWNTELAVKNIENIVKKLDIDLYTHVIDWEEFKGLQIAFLKASVVDLEMLSDNAIVVAIHKIAKEKGIKYFLAGTNLATESIMPPAWFYNIKYDSLNIKSIYKRYGGGLQLKSYPLLSFFDYLKYRYFNDIKSVSILNYVPYDKKAALAILKNELGWRDYGGKHGESKITQFYQSYILPAKYGIDKRRAFLSCLICSGQITRADALAAIQAVLYSPDKFKEDREYFLKKLDLKDEEFEAIMQAPIKSHYAYPSYDAWHKRAAGLRKKLIGLFKRVG